MNVFRILIYTFPARLLYLHFRNHLALTAVWGLLLALSTGLIGRFFGFHYLMLTPEYLGNVNFLSFSIIGAFFGGWVIIWNLTTYLLASFRFPFLAALRAPFTKFFINNSLIPLAFLSAYISACIWFQWHDELIARHQIAWNIGGFFTGMITVMLLLALYFYLTNKDILHFLPKGDFKPRPGSALLGPGQRLPTLWEIAVGVTRMRVDYYLTERLRLRPVRSVAHYNQHLIERVFRQNHFNAAMIQVVLLCLLAAQGLFIDREWARIPTAATIFLLATMVTALFGAIVFWFRRWSLLVFLLMTATVNFVTGKGYFNYRNPAYGLDYSHEKHPEYSRESLSRLASAEQMAKDRNEMLGILENWLARNRTPANPKPKMVFVCVSGGGLRSAVWALHTLQQGDIATNGRLLRSSVMISGASGGMLGAAYLREAYLRRQMGESVSEHDPELARDVGKDLLNPISFAIVATDLFFPIGKFQWGGHIYRKDRGYAFERQFNENCRGFFANRRLADYRAPESRALIPLMPITPFITNDSRRLLISPHGVGFLAAPVDHRRFSLNPEMDGVDFRQLFADQDADSLAFTSALRMNCTYPLILPNVWLPARPALEAMDAGFRDNYGITLAARFIQNYRDWILKNTSGVVILQIRSFNKYDPIASFDRKGVVESLFTPVVAAAGITRMQDYEHDNTLSLLQDLLGRRKLTVLRIMYQPVRKQREASMSFHLSAREMLDLEEAIALPQNQAAIEALRQILR